MTGAGSGIGEAVAQGLAAFGAQVICADMNAANAEAVTQSINQSGGKAQACILDMRDSAKIAKALLGVPPIDILVSTPSINVRKPMLEISDDEFDRIINLNLRGTFMLLRHVAKGGPLGSSRSGTGGEDEQQEGGGGSHGRAHGSRF